MERPPGRRLPPWAVRVVSFVAILAVLILLWESYKVVAKALDTTWPIRADNKSMPHVWDIIGELFEARRAGDDILLVLLLREAMFTFREAAVGFVLGAGFGFTLAIVFERSKLFERSLMPYVIASQTIPLVAIAPIIVVWGGRFDWPTWIPAAIIAAYLSFFPVTINTLRGLRSPAATSMELMRSYAATKNETLWKVQVPAALPYIFTALKVAATASVIGALVGELPSSLDRGLGRALLTFTYTFISAPEKLFAAVIISALLGIVFVSLVTYAERLALPPGRRISE
jgi:NitT/TauT family transport system permease protein